MSGNGAHNGVGGSNGGSGPGGVGGAGGPGGPGGPGGTGGSGGKAALCVVLRRAEAEVPDELRDLISKRFARVEQTDDAYAAMVSLLRVGAGAALVVVNPGEVDELSSLVGALHLYAPGVECAEFENMRLRKINAEKQGWAEVREPPMPREPGDGLGLVEEKPTRHSGGEHRARYEGAAGAPTGGASRNGPALRLAGSGDMPGGKKPGDAPGGTGLGLEGGGGLREGGEEEPFLSEEELRMLLSDEG